MPESHEFETSLPCQMRKIVSCIEKFFGCKSEMSRRSIWHVLRGVADEFETFGATLSFKASLVPSMAAYGDDANPFAVI